MAEPLVRQYGPQVPQRIADLLGAVAPAFDHPGFMRDVLWGYEALDLMARGRHIAQVLRRHLPADDEAALELLLASVREPVTLEEGSLASFLYLPHTCFVAEYGLAHFEASMRAQHLLTQRFTAEFSIRPFLEHHPQATLERLAQWTQDPSEHVRRLVSEGTRPRLPWGRRLKAFQADPTPVLNLLERLKDDPSLYVRRSVANNLNDIGKDHPDRLVALACRWWSESTRLGSEPLRAQRQWLVAHGLRSLLKAGHPGALGVLGHGELPEVRLLDPSLSPSPARMGARIRLGFSLHNPTDRVQSLLVDLRVHYRKAAGHTGPKVFKLRAVNLAPQATAVFAKTLSLAQMTTRQHHPGEHRVEALVNGQALALGSFELLP